MESAVLTVRWCVAIATGLTFLCCAVGNWIILLSSFIGILRGHPESSGGSFVLPYAGPILGLLFFLSIPVDGFATYWWLAFIIEPFYLVCVYAIVTSPFVDRSS